MAVIGLSALSVWGIETIFQIDTIIKDKLFET